MRNWRRCYPAPSIMRWRPARCATHWIPGKDSYRRTGWRRRRPRPAMPSDNRARTPRCSCRSYSRRRPRLLSVARVPGATLAYGIITRDTDTSASRRCSRHRVIVRTTRAPSTRCSKPCPSDKNETTWVEAPVPRRRYYGPTANCPDIVRTIHFPLKPNLRDLIRRSVMIFIDLY